MHNLFFVLGAPDAEMSGIERVINGQHIAYLYATNDGKRVHAGNAYRADAIEFIPPETTTIVLVECQPAHTEKWQSQDDIVVVDHHLPGDPGYGLPASEFWRASSLGQVYALLGITDIPHDDLVLAAMDSHPADAIRGLCPGVSAKEVLERKIQEIAIATQASPEKVQGEIYEFLLVLEGAPRLTIGDQRVTDLTMGKYGPDYLAIAGAQTGALFSGEAALITQKERDGARKITLIGHATPKCVEAFMQEYAPTHGLQRVYGVPARGFAGGYLEK